MALKEDYKDFIPPLSGLRYQIAPQGDGTSSIEDVTQYTQEGDVWSASIINATNSAVSEVQQIAEAAQTTASAAMPKSGGTFAGPLVAGGELALSVKQVRNISIGTADPSGGVDGDIYLKYTV